MKRLNTFLDDRVYDNLVKYAEKKKESLKKEGCSTSMARIINTAIVEYIEKH